MTWVTTHIGDCRDVLPTLEAGSVHCVVTSPPYWGLRDYGTASWDGGDPECDHRIGRVMGNANKGAVRDVLDGDRRSCKCGARRIDRQLGLEPTPEEYVANMVAVFREVRRVLRDDGTVWLNLGDSYANGGGTGGAGHNAIVGNTKANIQSRGQRIEGLAQKQLVGIPWRVAFALQADGWYLRSDIIWSKPNPMPESVTDRPTKSHEYVFLLSKRERYYFDQEAVREPLLSTPDEYLRAGKSVRENHAYGEVAGRPLGPSSFATVPSGRNIRSVWNIATQPYAGAHFAVFPEALVVPCIKAGTSERGVCAECGAPWERVVERTLASFGSPRYKAHGSSIRNDVERSGNFDGAGATTTGWRPSCDHDADTVPATVMDPFGGSGTVGRVANRLSRRAVLIELNPEYADLIDDRTVDQPLGLAVG